MATFSHFQPHFLSLSSHTSLTNTSLSFYNHHRHSCIHSNPRYFNAQSSILCLASTKKSRPSRKLLGDEELCNVLREFVVSVGLPEGHVPSTKELSQHGRKDLANIVRRRGHKVIKELLTNSAEEATSGFDSRRSLNGEFNEVSDHEETGQEEKLNDMIEGVEVTPSIDYSSNTGNNLVENQESSFVSSNEKDPPMSLQEKVEKFMKYGQLDAVEDDSCGDFKVNDSGQKSYHEQSSDKGEPVIYSEADVRLLAHGSNRNFGQNGSLLATMICPPTMDNYSSVQGSQSTDFDNNMHIEAGKMNNQIEVNHLKQMLHQKELELSRLKQDIEREKQALLILQAKAENEITKAQNLISEKDAELNAAEESLSGLVEAKIQYSGEGKMVEVAGSFNGWHQRIKLDPQPSSIVVDPVRSRKSRLWSTTLWLYPGVYEIKFIVDGHWKIDPEIESTIKGGIENNILRVVR